MRVANVAGRLSLVADDLAVDVEKVSGGAFDAEPQAVYERWDAFVEWAAAAGLAGRLTAAQASENGAVRYEAGDLGSPAPAPRQVFAIGLNYRAHAAESGFAVPDGEPPVFTKFQTSITGPVTEVEVPADAQVDWEVELVAVIARSAFRVEIEDALSHVAGYAVGQDLSERRLQMAAAPPQFSLGKSLPGFSPIGPWLVTLDEFADPNDLELGCAIDGETMQLGRTRDLIFSVAALVSKLSATTRLLPGDVIFTGTPSGVGLGRTPQRWLQPGEELVSHIEGIGELRQRFVAARGN